MGEELLRLKNIRKSFNSVTVLEDINITISKGEVIALVGENGAGKSTLSNIISGVLKPDGGQIFFEGKEYKGLTIKQAKDLGIKMVHQELLILPKLNVTANIFIGSEYQNHGWMDVPKMHEKASELLNTVGLSVSPKTRVAEIDIAGRQMIEIARAIATNAKIIILDEPTSSLSDVEIKKLFETVNRLKKQGISFIFVSHRLQEVLTLSDRIYILKDGRLTKELYPENTTEDEIVMNMVGRSYDDYYKRKRVYFGKEVLRIENYSGIDNKVLARSAHTPRNISLQLNEGEVLGIAGLVGAGRTELLRLIFGEDKKESGESRTQEKSEDFANRFGVLNAYGSYASMLEDDNIDLVYVATPHSLHYEHTMLCLNKGKAVLCEKPFALNYIQAKEMIDTAREKKLLLAEAMWMRYQPMAKKICDLVDSGIIGTPRLLLANKGELDLIGFAPERAGSTLLGLGVYAINNAFLVFGNNYEDVTSTAIFEENGLDGANAIILKYANGKMAMLSSSMIAPTSNKWYICGDDGMLEIQGLSRLKTVRHYNRKRELVQEFNAEGLDTGYEYEVQACMEALESGAIECPQMPHEETIAVMKLMDRLRDDWGLKLVGE